MFLAIDYYALIYTCIYLIFFIICYLIIQATRLEKLFNQGKTWQIRAAQLLLALILAYFCATAVMSLVNSTQINN